MCAAKVPFAALLLQTRAKKQRNMALLYQLGRVFVNGGGQRFPLLFGGNRFPVLIQGFPVFAKNQSILDVPFYVPRTIQKWRGKRDLCRAED